MNSSESRDITYLADYQPPPFLIDAVELEFELGDNGCLTTSRLQLRKNPASKGTRDLTLDGNELELVQINLDGEPLAPLRYVVSDEALTVKDVAESFTLEIKTRIYPDENLSYEGLYRSNAMFCTQCEAEGFRRITYYLDRPDVLSVFTTKIIANPAICPVMLSNGNLVSSTEREDGRREVVWHDPHPKPSYLFALVAGDLVSHDDAFTTASGRQVALELYVEPHNIELCEHAMESLKRSMAWDEQEYGCEYDLDVYMIVAVDHFNMGAMENKGLNVFNSKYVLADPSTATDTDYVNIEAVIAHEYFHNWTGNRVTCRDWFQLSLKEGLTVFRDQCFSQDMGSAAVKRIGDTRIMRDAQFREDAGPMAHPVRPQSYIEINNFYTVTVYNKGAEVIRMMHRLLGREAFRKGMDVYFERYDGKAVTTDDFVDAMQSASGVDLTQFRRWYDQGGTPVLSVSEAYDPDRKTYELTISQSCRRLDNQAATEPFHIPVAYGLLAHDGTPIAAQRILRDDVVDVSDQAEVLELTEPTHTFRFEGVDARPTVSLLRDFSAPVRIEMDRSDETLAFLARFDPDPLSRWDATQDLAVRIIAAEAHNDAGERAQDESLESQIDAFAEVFEELLDGHARGDVDGAFVAEAMTLPSVGYLLENLADVDVERIHDGRERLRAKLAARLRMELEDTYQALATNQGYAFDSKQAAARALRNATLLYLTSIGEPDYDSLALEHYRHSDNMTDTLGALVALNDRDSDARHVAFTEFESAWHDNGLVMDKWFGLQACSSLPRTLERVRELQSHRSYDANNPNRIRALIGSFCHRNLSQFHAPDGSGYEFFAEALLDIDSRNPQLAARLATAISSWRRLDQHRQSLIESKLESLIGSSGLSRDCFEILSRTLGSEN
jgi:aminopeptidase N